MRTNLVVAFLTALCLAVVGASADLVAQKKGGGKKGGSKEPEPEPVHFVFRDDQTSDNIMSDCAGSLALGLTQHTACADPGGVYSDGEDGGSASITSRGFSFKPGGNLKGKEGQFDNRDDIVRKVFFDFLDRPESLVSPFDESLPSPFDNGTGLVQASLIVYFFNGDDELFCTPDDPPDSQCIPDGAFRGLDPISKTSYLSPFRVILLLSKTDSLLLDFKSNEFPHTDYVTVTCINNETNANTPTGTKCTKWTIEAGDTAVAKLRNPGSDTAIGHFRMPFKITACLDASDSICQ